LSGWVQSSFDLIGEGSEGKISWVLRSQDPEKSFAAHYQDRATLDLKSKKKSRRKGTRPREVGDPLVGLSRFHYQTSQWTCDPASEQTPSGDSGRDMTCLDPSASSLMGWSHLRGLPPMGGVCVYLGSMTMSDFPRGAPFEEPCYGCP